MGSAIRKAWKLGRNPGGEVKAAIVEHRREELPEAAHKYFDRFVPAAEILAEPHRTWDEAAAEGMVTLGTKH